MENLELYNKVRAVPEEAKKPITGGKLNGMTDIDPMWRIKVLTENFGMCGVGWYFEITESRSEYTELDGDVKEVVYIVKGNLYVKVNGEWSKPIYGIGGSKLVALEKGAPKANDECMKMAATDALSVACKNLGIGADVYWEKDRDKYTAYTEDSTEKKSASTSRKAVSTANSKASTDSDDAEKRKELRQKIIAYGKEHGMTNVEIARDYKLNNDSSLAQLQAAWDDLNAPTLEQQKLEDEFAAIDEAVPF